MSGAPARRLARCDQQARINEREAELSAAPPVNSHQRQREKA